MPQACSVCLQVCLKERQYALQAALQAATKEIDIAAKKGVYHKNNAARKVSRIASAVNQMA